MTNPNQPADQLAAQQRIDELEAQLAQERALLQRMQQRLATKEREIIDIHRSRAWSLVTALRSLKLRMLDPLLGAIGIAWPHRRATASTEPSATIDPRTAAYDVVCFSTCEWDSRFQRPQQLMSLFAAAGHRLFYVSQQFRADGPSCVVIRKRPNVYEVTLRGEELNVYAQGLGNDARDLLMQGLDALRLEASLGPTAMIVYLPFWWPLARQARVRFTWPVIYDCIDFHAGFATVRKAMVAQEEEMLAEADAVVASSASLEEHALRKRNAVVLLRNGCDFEHFANTQRAKNARPVIGYYGAIADWFDSTLVADLAERRPDWDFILVGSTYGAAIARLARLPNVLLPGEEPYESLPDWLSRFDVNIIPFKRTKLTEATNPVKVYEILASGKPIVSVPIPEVAALAPLVRLASNADEFEREIEAVLANPDEGIEERRAFAREHTWEKRFEVLRRVTQDAVDVSAAS
ncbi:MAG: glycosyltransferase [Acidobacteriota bacterium]|nr:glycosyltransferase [Acidobacteriota bacterium]